MHERPRHVSADTVASYADDAVACAAAAHADAPLTGPGGR